MAHRPMIIVAYIDPGMGALIWQTITAAFVGLIFYLKKTRRWIVNGFRKMFQRGQKAATLTANKTPAAEVEAKTEVR